MPPSTNTTYIMTVATMMGMTVLTIAGIVIFHPGDNTIVIATLVGLVASTTTSLLAFMKSQETHLSVNSRLDAFVANARAAAHAQGIIQGHDEGVALADARTDALAVAKSHNETGQGPHE